MITNDIFVKFSNFVESGKLSILRKYDKFKRFSESLESSRYDDYVFVTCRISNKSVCINVQTKQPMFFEDKQSMFECVEELLNLPKGVNILEIK